MWAHIPIHAPTPVFPYSTTSSSATAATSASAIRDACEVVTRYTSRQVFPGGSLLFTSTNRDTLELREDRHEFTAERFKFRCNFAGSF